MRCNPRCSGCPAGAKVQSWQSTQQKGFPSGRSFLLYSWFDHPARQRNMAVRTPDQRDAGPVPVSGIMRCQASCSGCPGGGRGAILAKHTTKRLSFREVFFALFPVRSPSAAAQYGRPDTGPAARKALASPLQGGWRGFLVPLAFFISFSLGGSGALAFFITHWVFCFIKSAVPLFPPKCPMASLPSAP